MNQSVHDFFQYERVMVMGGAGFVGTQLVTKLVKEGADVFVIDNFSRGQTTVDGVEYFNIDISDPMRSPKLMKDLMKLYNVTHVFNLTASVAGVMYNMDHQLEMYHSNINLLANPAVAASAAGVEYYLQTSSVCIYAPENNAPSSEELGFDGSPHAANAGYAEAKRDGERIALWSSIPNVFIVRPSNIVGPGDYYDDKAHVLPAFIKRAHEIDDGGYFTLYGNPEATREFIHCRDVAEGMMFVMANGKSREAYNLGCDGLNTISMRNLAENVLQKLHKKAIILTDETQGGGDERRWSDSRKAYYHTGWEFQTPLSDAIDESIDDYQARF